MKGARNCNESNEPLQDCILLEEENDEIRRSVCMGTEAESSFDLNCNTTLEEFEINMQAKVQDPYISKFRSNNSVFLF